ncbi:NAD(P)-dependent glycerol-3-phosphate dehydrogenase [Candidatus Poribacteria bacterium]|nr:NAD(P)-dependent glycerol-3-phosphate dehydrogenase [Candidatus Poribacteria bacterium]
MKVVVYGSGAFGFALAKYLGDKFRMDKAVEICLYDRNEDLISHIKTTRTHPIYYPDIPLPIKVESTSDIRCVRRADLILLVVPSQALRDASRELAGYISPEATVLNAAKGLELGSCKRPSQVIGEELSKVGFKGEIATFSGGTIASEMIMGAALGAEIACPNREVARWLQEFMASDRLRIYANTDIIGVEYAGAFKNVISIGAGISDGLNNPWGTKTLLISRASAEVKRLALKLGAQPHTFSAESQAWCNDLWMSCMGNTRNRYFGELIGRGLSVEEAFKVMSHERKLVEGYYTTKSAYHLAREHKVDAPIIKAVHDVLYLGRDPREMMSELMSRSLKFLD